MDLAPNHEGQLLTSDKAPKEDNLETPFIATNTTMMSQETKGEGNPPVSEEYANQMISRYARSTKERILTKVKPVQKNDCRSNKTQGMQIGPRSNRAAIYATRVSATPRLMLKVCTSGEPDE